MGKDANQDSNKAKSQDIRDRQVMKDVRDVFTKHNCTSAEIHKILIWLEYGVQLPPMQILDVE